MSISDNGTRNQYTATAAQTIFPYTFEVFSKDDIAVEQNGALLTEGTHYTVSGVGVDAGGNVTLATGATSGDIMTLYRNMNLERLTDYQQNGDFLAAEVNDDFDRLWAAQQQINGTAELSIRAPIDDTALNSSNTELADIATRSGKVLGFDSTGRLEYVNAAIGAGNINMNSYQINNLGKPTDLTDAVRLGDVLGITEDGLITIPSVSESKTLTDGQTVVTFTEYTTTLAEFHINGVGVDSRRLNSNDMDVPAATETSITLLESYPAGTVVTLTKRTGTGEGIDSGIRREFVHNFATLAEAKASTKIAVGDSFETSGYYSASGGGGGTYDTVSGTGTANGRDIIAHDTESISFVLRIESWVTTWQVGVNSSNTGAENAAIINGIILDLRSTGKALVLSPGEYDVDRLRFYREVPIWGVGADSVKLTSTESSGWGIEIGDTAYRQAATTLKGWKCQGFTFTGNANLDYGLFLCNIHGDSFSNIVVKDCTKAGAYGVLVTGNPSTVGETNPHPVVIGAFYNEFHNCYVFDNTNGVIFTGVSNEGQANANSWYGGPIRQNDGINLHFEICNDNYISDASLEGAATTVTGVKFGALSNGNTTTRCRYEGSYTSEPWIIDSGAINSNLVNNYYGAYYTANDPKSASFSKDSGSNTKIDEYRLSLGNVSTLVVEDILVDEITAKASGRDLDILPRTGRDVRFLEDDGSLICQFGNNFGRGGLRFTPLGLFYPPNGSTANRPTPTATAAHYFDTTLGKPIWWNGSVWKDATGATV